MDKKLEAIDYLKNSFDIPLRDPVWKHIYLNEGFQKLIYSAPFLRLSRILQLGPVVYVYPGARHTRFEHSIGVFWAARLLLLALLSNKKSQKAEFSPTLFGIKGFLSAALLHDIGHYPYSHLLEHLSLDIMAIEKQEQKMRHESIGAKRILREPIADILGEIGTSPEFVASLIDDKQAIPNSYAVEGLFYRSLLSGTLDPDKLDYLNRDAYYCGIPSAYQDLEYLFSQVYLHRSERCSVGTATSTAETFYICIPEKSVIIIENIIFSRYLMYSSVYWYRGVRALSAPVLSSLTTALTRELLPFDILYDCDDWSFLKLIRDLEGFPEKSLSLDAQIPMSFTVVEEISLLHLERKPTIDFTSFREIKGVVETLHQGFAKISPTPIDSWQVLLDFTGDKKMDISDIFVSEFSHKEDDRQVVPFIKSRTFLRERILASFQESLGVFRIIVPAKIASALKGSCGILREYLEKSIS